MRKLVIFLITCLVLAGILTTLIGWGYRELERWGSHPFPIENSKEITLERGMSLSRLARILEEEKLIPHYLYFEWWVKLFSDYRGYQAGRYLLQEGTTPLSLDQKIKAGEIYEPVILEVAIPEGFTLSQIEDRAIGAELGSSTEFELEFSSDKLRTQFPKLPKNSLEGYLFPATYRFTELPTPQVFTELLVKTFFERLPADYEQSLKPFGLSLHQAVILASLIERETQRDDERSIVSEVIHNRLNKGVALAIDASIIYGIPDFDGNLRRRHLNDVTNPYNTRKHRGLPPGPICSPGEASLRAVVTPTDHGYWYYVVDAKDFSKHRFARTLKEHNRNVREFWKAKKSSSD